MAWGATGCTGVAVLDVRNPNDMTASLVLGTPMMGGESSTKSIRALSKRSGSANC